MSSSCPPSWGDYRLFWSFILSTMSTLCQHFLPAEPLIFFTAEMNFGLEIALQTQHTQHIPGLSSSVHKSALQLQGMSWLFLRLFLLFFSSPLRMHMAQLPCSLRTTFFSPPRKTYIFTAKMSFWLRITSATLAHPQAHFTSTPECSSSFMHLLAGRLRSADLPFMTNHPVHLII